MTDPTRARLEALFEQLIRQQRTKVLKIAQQHYPHLTADDVLNPHDFPVLEADSQFNFEDGILSGYLSAQMAMRAELVEG